MGWQPTTTGSGTDPGDPGSGDVIEGGETQTDGSVRYVWGVDTSGRPTFTDAGTTDTPAILVYYDNRYHLREVP